MKSILQIFGVLVLAAIILTTMIMFLPLATGNGVICFLTLEVVSWILLGTELGKYLWGGGALIVYDLLKQLHFEAE